MAGLTTTTAGLPDNFPRRLEILGPNTTAKPFVPSRSGRASSSFRGVSSQGSRWRARICVSKVEYTIGDFDSEDAAAKAYDVEAIKRGKFHQLNFIYRNLNDTPENVQRLREAQRRSRRATGNNTTGGQSGATRMAPADPAFTSAGQDALPVVQQSAVTESSSGGPSGGSTGRTGSHPADESVDNGASSSKEDADGSVLGVLTIPREDRVMKARLKVRRSRGELGDGPDGRRPSPPKHSSFPQFHQHGGPGSFRGYMGGLPEAFPSARWGPGVMAGAPGGRGPWTGAPFGSHPNGFILPGPSGPAGGQYTEPWSSTSFPQSQGLAQGLDDGTRDRQQTPHPFGSPSPFAPMGMARPPMGMHRAPSSGMYFGHGPSMNGSMARLANTDAGEGPFGTLQHGPLPLPWHSMHMHASSHPPPFDTSSAAIGVGRRQDAPPVVADGSFANAANSAPMELPTGGNQFPPLPPQELAAPPPPPPTGAPQPTTTMAASSSSSVASGDAEPPASGIPDRQETQEFSINSQPPVSSGPDTSPATSTQSSVRNPLSFGFARPVGRIQGAAAYGNPNMMPMSYDAPHRAFVSMGSSVGTEYVPQAPQAGMARPHVPIWRDGGGSDPSRHANNASGQHRERTGLDALAAVTESVMQARSHDGGSQHSASVAAASQKNAAALENGRAEYKRLLEFLRHPRTHELLPAPIRQKLKVVLFTGGPQTVASFLSAIDIYESNPQGGHADLLETLEHMYSAWSRAAAEMGVLVDPNAMLAGQGPASSTAPHDAVSASTMTHVGPPTPPLQSALSAGLTTSVPPYPVGDSLSTSDAPRSTVDSGVALSTAGATRPSSAHGQAPQWSVVPVSTPRDAPVQGEPSEETMVSAAPSSGTAPASTVDHRVKRPADAMERTAATVDAPAAKRVHL